MNVYRSSRIDWEVRGWLGPGFWQEAAQDDDVGPAKGHEKGSATQDQEEMIQGDIYESPSALLLAVKLRAQGRQSDDQAAK